LNKAFFFYLRGNNPIPQTHHWTRP